MIEYHCAKSRGRLKSLLWEIWIVQVPNVRIQRHLRRHLLETKHSIWDSDSEICCLIWMPWDFSYWTFYWVRIFEDHSCLCRYSLWKMFRLLSTEVFFKQIYFIILSDALLSTSYEIFGCLSKAKIGISVEFLEIFSNITWLGVVVILRPTYFQNKLNSIHNFIMLPPTWCFIPLLLVATLSVLT